MAELTPSSFPRNLSIDDVKWLADFSIKYPLSERWVEIAKLLTPEQKAQINKRIDSVKFDKSNSKYPLKSESQGMDEATWNEKIDSIEANKFFGNMGQPDTPKEFKSRYGVWPPGYDSRGYKF